MEIDYLMVLYVRLGVKIRDLHAKDSSSFCKRLISLSISIDKVNIN